jgi:alkylated DNA repair dioxygenase AlkB
MLNIATHRKHSDNLNNLVIASVSLGAERTFIMSPRLPSKARSVIDKALGENDLDKRKNVKWV